MEEAALRRLDMDQREGAFCPFPGCDRGSASQMDPRPFGYPDLAIKEVNKDTVTIKKIGILPVPVHVRITYKDGSHEEIYKTAEVWKNGNEFFEIKTNSNLEIDRIILSNKVEIPDINRTDNIYIANN